VGELGWLDVAAGGHFQIRRWARSTGVDLGGDPAEPEQIGQRWAEIASDG
jgi:hypothetical protein